MSNVQQTTVTEMQPRRATASRRAGFGGLLQTIVFALAVGFAAAIVLGLVP